MDSATQILLGAGVGALVGGRRYGRKALLWGGACGLLPDLDVFLPFDDPVRSFTEHRGFSHSVFVLSLISPLLAWLIVRLHRLERSDWRHWCLLVWLSLITHPILDCFTIYGTQIFWPLPMQPVSIGSIFIIDPHFTLPLLVSFIAFLIMGRRQRSLRINGIALGISCAYLLTSFLFQSVVEHRVGERLVDRGIDAVKYRATPTPFNILLWRILVIEPSSYREGYYSLLSGERPIEFATYPRRPELLEPIADSRSVRRLNWFTHGYLFASEEAGEISLTDIRMGFTPKFIFSFVVGRRNGDVIEAVAPERNPSSRIDFDDIKAIFELF